MRKHFKSLIITKDTKLEDFPVEYTKDFPDNPDAEFLDAVADIVEKAIEVAIKKELNLAIGEFSKIPGLYLSLKAYHDYIAEGVKYLMKHQDVFPLESEVIDNCQYLVGYLDLFAVSLSAMMKYISAYGIAHLPKEKPESVKETVVRVRTKKPTIH